MRRKPGKLDWIRERLEQHAVMRVLFSTIEGFIRDEVTDHAAAMTYYGIFSLFPLMLLFRAIGGIVLQNNDWVREQVIGLIVGLLPQGQDELRKMIVDVIKAKGTAAGVGIVLLLWSALGWFQVIDKNVNQIWGVAKPRPFIQGKLFALAMVAAIGGVALLSFGASAGLRLLAHYTDMIPGSAAIWQAIVTGVSLLVIALAFYLLYRYAPQRRLHFGDVWPAALATAVLWELTRYGRAI
jgi:membrane protein